MQSADILTQMCAAHLYVACQALDLRVLNLTFLEDLQNSVSTVTRLLVPNLDVALQSELDQKVFHALSSSWNATTSLDLDDRCDKLGEASLPNVINFLHEHRIALSSETLVQFSTLR